MPIEIDIKLILKNRIENRAECETWAVDVGGQVEAIITSFVEEGKWNVGFKTSDDVIKDASCFSNIHFDGEWKDGEDVITPVLWFGAHDTPMKRWSIDKNILPAEYEFWFLEDGYEAMYRIVPDSSGYFDIWYFAECGREFADISDIMKSCPVNFQESDSPEEIK